MSELVVRAELRDSNLIDLEYRNAARSNRLLRIRNLILRDIGRNESDPEPGSFRTLVDEWYAFCRGEPFIYVPKRARDKSPRTQWFNRRNLIEHRLKDAVLSMDFISLNARGLLEQDDPERRLVKDHAIPLKVIRCELKKLARNKELSSFDVEEKLLALYWLGVITKVEDYRLEKKRLRESMPDGPLTPRARYLSVDIALCEMAGSPGRNWRDDLTPLPRLV